MIILSLTVAGGLGAALRFLTDLAARRRFGSDRPNGILIINVVGSLILGLLTGAVIFHSVSSNLTAIAGTGFCGGYTTFSAASVDTVRLIERGHRSAAGIFAAANLVISIAAATAGLALLWAV